MAILAMTPARAGCPCHKYVHFEMGIPARTLKELTRKPATSAKYACVCVKCRKVAQKCRFFFGHNIIRSFVFIHIPASFVIFNIFFSVHGAHATLPQGQSSFVSHKLPCVFHVGPGPFVPFLVTGGTPALTLLIPATCHLFCLGYFTQRQCSQL